MFAMHGPSQMLSLWGKTNNGNEDERPSCHPLLYHLLDAGNVARVLLTSPLGSHWCARIGQALGCPRDSVVGLVPFLVALHDVGKAAPDFQRKCPELWHEQTESGLMELAPLPLSFNHGAESYAVLAGRRGTPGLLSDLGLLESGQHRRDLLRVIALALGSHHGTFLPPDECKGYPQVPVQVDERDAACQQWMTLRSELVAKLREVFVPDLLPLKCQLTDLSALCVMLNGLVILADWMASDECCFPPAASSSIDHYPPLSRKRAAKVVADRGLLGFADLPDSQTFGDLFPSSSYPGFTPRPIQRKIAALDPRGLPHQALVIIEAPTGEGKTEAALQLAAIFSHQGVSQGFYFALPTIATSNQMYERIHKFLETHAGSATPCLLPVNGQAEMSPDVDKALKKLAGAGVAEDDGPGVELDTWFLPRKRSLLAPYGVGTVDQAMMSALNLRHVALRLLGLSGKIVIVDEIHAYDTYMSTIIDRLLEWLRAMGTTVILLSASLPPKRRDSLIRAYLGVGSEGTTREPVLEAPYPSITVVDAGAEDQTTRVQAVEGTDRSRSVVLERRTDGDELRQENAEFVVAEVADGGCACWVCNTVGEAQAAHEAVIRVVGELPEDQRPDVHLFHARFLLKDRQRIEEQALRMFGPGREHRPERAILIATQVVEQSLDLDFDIMMTQLAPADLLIQRMGRLQRHDRERPGHFDDDSPRLVILMPPVEGGVVLGKSRYVYESFILLKTLIALAGRADLVIPADVPGIVAAVYDDELPPATGLPDGVTATMLENAWERLLSNRHQNKEQAKLRLLGAPDKRGHFNRGADLLTMDENRDWVGAQTRLGLPNVRVVVLDAGDPRLGASGPLGGAPRPLMRHEIMDLRLHSASITNRPFVQHIWDTGVRPSAFQKCPALLDYYLVVTEGGSYSWTTDHGVNRMRVSEKVGLIFTDGEVMQ